MKKYFVLFLAFIPMFAFSQTALTIDKALSDSTAYLKGRIPAKSKVAVLNFTSEWPQLSNYVIEELMAYIVNEGSLAVVDRQNLETIRKEMYLQLSGEVSDDTAVSIGKMLGAQTIISGGIQPVGSTYRLRIRAISVETAQIQGMQNVDVVHDSRLAALTGTASAGGTAVTANAKTNTKTTNAKVNTVAIPVSANGWQPIKYGLDKKDNASSTTATVKTAKEIIDGQEKEVLSIDVYLGRVTGAGASTQDPALIQALKEGQGVRFKVMGDGKKWVFCIGISPVDVWQQHCIEIKTQNGSIVEFDIPYSSLKQLIPSGWGSQKRSFKKEDITSMRFERNNHRFSHELGSASIKIFDFEIY